jgi:hypothetical protein
VSDLGGEGGVRAEEGGGCQGAVGRWGAKEVAEEGSGVHFWGVGR